MDVRLDHGGVDAQLASLDNPLLAGQLDQALVQRGDDFRSQCLSLPHHCFGIRHFRQAQAAEAAVDQVGAHLALQRFVAPVADVFEQQHAQHDFGRGLGPTAATALGAALSLCFVNAVQQLVIVEQLVDLAHPRFPKIGHFRGQQTVPQTRLGVFSAGHIG